MFVNISTDLYASTISLISLRRAATSGKVKIVSARTLSSAVGSGRETVSSRLFSTGTLTTSHSPEAPTRNLAIVSGEPTVAESPMIWNGLPEVLLSLSSAIESWLPLLSSASSWTSSTTTHLSDPRASLILLPVSIAWSVSGVVISMSGGTMLWLDLSALVVSPCLTPRRMSNLLHHHFILSSMSLLRALRGVM